MTLDFGERADTENLTGGSEAVLSYFSNQLRAADIRAGGSHGDHRVYHTSLILQLRKLRQRGNAACPKSLSD